MRKAFSREGAPRALATRLRAAMRRFSRRGAAALVIAGSMIAGLSASILPALAAERTRDFAFGYNIYVGGVRIGAADLSGRVAPGGYVVNSRLATSGIAEWVIAAVFDFRSDGRIDASGGVFPTQFEANGKYEERTLQVAINYVDGAPFEVTSSPPFKKRPYAIDPRAQFGAMDPISAIIAAMTPDDPALLCERIIPIFDGRRRYDLIFDGVIDTFEREGQQIVECAGRLKRVSGFKPKFMKRPDFKFDIRAIVGADGEITPQRLTGETPVGTIAISMRRKK